MFANKAEKFLSFKWCGGSEVIDLLGKLNAIKFDELVNNVLLSIEISRFYHTNLSERLERGDDEMCVGTF